MMVIDFITIYYSFLFIKAGDGVSSVHQGAVDLGVPYAERLDQGR
jgi:hypothetical protein